MWTPCHLGAWGSPHEPAFTVSSGWSFPVSGTPGNTDWVRPLIYLLIFGKRFSANSYLNLLWTDRNILNFTTSVLRVKNERALASSGSCAHSTRCIPLLCQDLVKKDFTGICLSVCTPVSEHKLDTDARMHRSHRPVSCVFIVSVGRIHAVI